MYLISHEIAGKSGIITITFKPGDLVKPSITDSARVKLSRTTLNYDIITVRGKKWKFATTTNA